MAERSQEQQFSELVGKIFADPKFAESMEHKPEETLRTAGYHLNDEQRNALRANAAAAAPNLSDARAVAAFVRPVVSILTKGTRPVVNVVVRTIVIQTTGQQERER